MKSKILSTIVTAAMTVATLADDTSYVLSDKVLLLEERMTVNEKKIKQLSSAQTKTANSLKETKADVENVRHNMTRLELEQIRSAENQPKVYIPQQYSFHQSREPERVSPSVPMAQVCLQHPEFVVSPYTGRLVSVRGIPSRQLVKDPLVGRLFLIP